MYESTRNGTLGVMLAIGVALFRYGTVHAGRDAIGAVLDKFGWLDGKSRSDIERTSMKVYKMGMYVDTSDIPDHCRFYTVEVMKAWNRAYKRTWVRTKKTSVDSGLKLRRDMDTPIVFYLVSKHQKPQKAHEPLQGKVVVDAKWRTVLKGRKELSMVRKYISSNHIITVQNAMGAPWYLISRINCRHHLIPLRTSVVLSSSLKDLNAKYQKKRTGIKRPITDAQRAQALRELRGAVYNRLRRLVDEEKPVR